MCGLPGVKDIANFQIWSHSPFGLDYSLWGGGVKKLNQIESVKKFMQAGVDAKCMHTNFGGHGLFCFGDYYNFQNWRNFPFGPWTIYSPMYSPL